MIVACVVALALAVQEPTYDQGGALPYDTDFYPTTIAGLGIGGPAASVSWNDAEIQWQMSMGLIGSRRLVHRPRPASVARGELEPLMEDLAEHGEGRALLWLIAHRSGTAEERAEGRRRDLERLGRVEDERWVARGLLALAADPPDGERLPLLSLAERRARVGEAPEVRWAARLAWAALIRGEEPERADAFVLGAAWLFAGAGPELASPRSLEELRALTALFLDALAAAERDHAVSEFVEAPDGMRIPRLVPAPDPAVTWRPAVELLAARGAPAARLHLLRTTSLGSASGRAVVRTQLTELCASELAPEELRALADQLDWLAIELGAEVVEPRVRALMARVSADEARALLAGLARGLYLVPAGRTRGAALMRELGALTREPLTPPR
jgi:hypothetical protein